MNDEISAASRSAGRRGRYQSTDSEPGSAGGMAIMKRGLPSARATMALPASAACAITLLAFARYSASVKTLGGVEPWERLGSNGFFLSPEYHRARVGTTPSFYLIVCGSS